MDEVTIRHPAAWDDGRRLVRGANRIDWLGGPPRPDVGVLFGVAPFHDAHRHLRMDSEPAVAGSVARGRRADLEAARRQGALWITDMGLDRIHRWMPEEKPTHVESALRGVIGAGADFAHHSATRVRSPAEAAARVAEVASAGADVVKVFVNGSGLGEPSSALARTMTRAELLAACDEARRCALPVAAHCHGGSALHDCLEAGVAWIEHGLYLSDEDLVAVREAGAALTLTLGVYLDAVPSLEAHTRALVSQALETGTRLRVGTDSPSQTMAHQIWWLARLGMPLRTALDIACGAPTGTSLRELADGSGILLFEHDPSEHLGGEPLALLPPMSP